VTVSKPATQLPGPAWMLMNQKADWQVRGSHGESVFDDHLWVFGGWTRERGSLGDVCYANDGKDWSELKLDVIWSPRHKLPALQFHDKLCTMADHADVLSREVWTLRTLDG